MNKLDLVDRDLEMYKAGSKSVVEPQRQAGQGFHAEMPLNLPIAVSLGRICK